MGRTGVLDVLRHPGFHEQQFVLIAFHTGNCSEITAKSIRKWLNELGVKTSYIEPGSPWENGYSENFNGKLRDKLLNGKYILPLTGGKNPDRTFKKSI